MEPFTNNKEGQAFAKTWFLYVALYNETADFNSYLNMRVYHRPLPVSESQTITDFVARI